MACITPDGKLTESAKKILNAAKEPLTPDEISKATGIPLFRVRSSTRELHDLQMLEKSGETFKITSIGEETLER